MYAQQPKKMLVMNILDILRKYTDEDHRLSQKDIIEILKTEYGMTADRKAVRRNLTNLMEAGYEIEYSESTRMVLNKKTGKPEKSILIGGFTIVCRNERITLGLLPLDGLPVSSSGHLLVTAIGKTGMDETAWSPVDGDPSLTRVELKGKLFLETFEGSIRLPGRIAPVMTALDVYGSPLQVIRAASAGKDVWNFELDGRIPSGNFLLER